MKNPSPDRVAIEEGVVVGSGGGRELRADVYTPPGAVANGAGILLVHGGGWMNGDRTQLRGYGILLGRAGYTCVACEYRLAPETTWPALLDDVRTAFDWMRTHARELEIDPGRIALEGNSAGGHLALMLAATASPGEITACIAVYAPTDLSRRVRLPDGLDRDRYGGRDPSAIMLDGGDDELRAKASPVRYASAAFPPTMLIHGTQDELVHPDNSLLMYRALSDAGAKAELHFFEGQVHAFDRESAYGRQCAALMTLFLNRHLAPRPAAAK